MAAPSTPFLFPQTESSVLPDPSTFFSPDLLSSALPTNSFFQNFVLNNGDQPEYIHPYLIKSASSSLTVCYPSRTSTPAYIYQNFVPDLTISAAAGSTSTNHVISSFDDLSVTLDASPSLRWFLVRGSPYVTCSTLFPTQISISSIHAFLSVVSNADNTKHEFQFNNGQTYLCYSSSPLVLTSTSTTQLVSQAEFSGTLRFTILIDRAHEPVFDKFSSCHPVSGRAEFRGPYCLEYKWETEGCGELLLLAHPLHRRLLEEDGGCGTATILEDFKYNSIDGELVGVVGSSWLLQTDPIPITWHSCNGLREEGREEIIASLVKDVEALSSNPITTTSSYFYGKAIARAARFALIAEELGFTDVIPTVTRFLRDSITPWLDGTFGGNGFLHDPKWGGVVTKQGSSDSGADFGFGIYNDHHYHLGYFLYSFAVLAKMDHSWGRKYGPKVYSLMADFMSLNRGSCYTRLRCFDLWKLHSWAGGLTQFADGRNQESTSEAVNAYYSAGLLGLSYEDPNLVSVASTLTAFEVRSAETWWHVREGEELYEEEFRRQNRVMGVLWANKRDSGLWFAPPEWKECRLGIQLLPLLPITKALFRDVDFARELVEWTLPALARDGVGEGWKGFVYALEGLYDNETALAKTRQLEGFDDGNSLSNMLWWLFSRRYEEDEGLGRACWFGRFCR